jgi:S-adenosylmethionine:tRNA ribosyltransferase-isomerase
MENPFLDYDLPPHLIAQHPAPERDQARLLVVRRAHASLSHYVFQDLPKLLAPGDLVILNNTRVLPARLLGHRERTGGKWEGLFLRQQGDGLWEILSQTRGHLSEGETILIDPGPLKLVLVEKSREGRWSVLPSSSGSPPELLARHGHIPLPPYIRKGRGSEWDEERYQTVFAQRDGSVAAPTAGLHLTDRLFDQLEKRRIERAFVTLHVGLGTFQPIQVDDIKQHHMHSEWSELPPPTAAAIKACKDRGGRVVAVGTTSVRVLETAASSGELTAWSGETELFIHPPFHFRIVDALVTNFHLPRSTLLLLVSAFAGVELIQKAYRTAIEQQYRFYSYGDAMLIV